MEEMVVLCAACFHGNFRIVKYLIEECGADISVDNYEPLCEACSTNELEIVKYIIEELGVDPNVQNGEPLIRAATRGHLDLVKYLMSKGAKHYIRENFALCMAACHNRVEIVKYLVQDWHADIHAIADWPIYAAISADYMEIFEFLKPFYSREKIESLKREQEIIKMRQEDPEYMKKLYAENGLEWHAHPEERLLSETPKTIR